MQQLNTAFGTSPEMAAQQYAVSAGTVPAAAAPAPSVDIQV